MIKTLEHSCANRNGGMLPLYACETGAWACLQRLGMTEGHKLLSGPGWEAEGMSSGGLDHGMVCNAFTQGVAACNPRHFSGQCTA